MKLGPAALAEIVRIVAEGLSEGRDISQGLRDIELIEVSGSSIVELTEEYRSRAWGGN